MKTTRTLFVATACLALTGLALADTTDTFDPGSNTGGWIISGNPTIDAAGGNPGAWLHNNNADTFAPIVRTTINGNPFSGDYRDMGVTNITFDAQTIFRNFGDPLGYEMSILLRDTKGTANVDDDDYAYYVGPNVPLMGEGWTHYDFEIPSASTDAVPAGWTGGWVGDLESFRPGVDWNDVITSVDQVEIWFINPAFFAILATWDVGVDNMTIVIDDAPCTPDITGDGEVGPADLAQVLDNWGVNPGHPADLNGDGEVGPADLALVLDNWGQC